MSEICLKNKTNLTMGNIIETHLIFVKGVMEIASADFFGESELARATAGYDGENNGMRRRETMAYSASSRTRQRLYETATGLFLKQGYENTTIRQIAAAAEVSTGTVYRYFPNKSDFLTFYPTRSVDHLRHFAAAVPDDVGLFEVILRVLMEDVRGNLELFYRSVERNGERVYESNDLRWGYWSSFASDAEHFEAEMAVRQSLIDLYGEILEEGKRRGELEADADTEALAQIIVAIFFQESERHLRVTEKALEQALRRNVGVLLEGRLREGAA